MSLRPSSSSAARMAPTRPSIMSLGAITSAPARACDSAVRASSSTLASLSTDPSARSRPQWPWLVYSHRHRSAITSTSGWASLIARVASWTAPSSSQAPEPSSSLCAGMPKSRTRGDAQRVGLARLGDGAGDREPVDAGHGADRQRARRGPPRRRAAGRSRRDPAASRARGRAAPAWRAGGAGAFAGRARLHRRRKAIRPRDPTGAPWRPSPRRSGRRRRGPPRCR